MTPHNRRRLRRALMRNARAAARYAGRPTPDRDQIGPALPAWLVMAATRRRRWLTLAEAVTGEYLSVNLSVHTARLTYARPAIAKARAAQDINR